MRKPLFILPPFPAVFEENISAFLFPSSSDCQTCYTSKFKFAKYIRKKIRLIDKVPIFTGNNGFGVNNNKNI